MPRWEEWARPQAHGAPEKPRYPAASKWWQSPGAGQERGRRPRGWPAASGLRHRSMAWAQGCAHPTPMWLTAEAPQSYLCSEQRDGMGRLPSDPVVSPTPFASLPPQPLNLRRRLCPGRSSPRDAARDRPHVPACGPPPWSRRWRWSWPACADGSAARGGSNAPRSWPPR
jgi:hypothetical protein